VRDDTPGRVEAIWLKRAVRGPMDPVPEAELIADEGIAGDANRGRSTRQVTIIEREVFEGIRTELPDADPAMRRANVMVSGLPLAESRGRILAVGAARIQVRGETRPCERMDAQCDGLTAALEPSWNGGAYGTVLEGGLIRVGDAVSFEDTD